MARKPLTDEELSVWEVIREHPGELGFILQERDYNAYIDTFGASDQVILTEEQFNLVKNYFNRIGKGNEQYY